MNNRIKHQLFKQKVQNESNNDTFIDIEITNFRREIKILIKINITLI